MRLSRFSTTLLALPVCVGILLASGCASQRHSLTQSPPPQSVEGLAAAGSASGERGAGGVGGATGENGRVMPASHSQPYASPPVNMTRYPAQDLNQARTQASSLGRSKSGGASCFT